DKFLIVRTKFVLDRLQFHPFDRLDGHLRRRPIVTTGELSNQMSRRGSVQGRIEFSDFFKIEIVDTKREQNRKSQPGRGVQTDWQPGARSNDSRDTALTLRCQIDR